MWHPNNSEKRPERRHLPFSSMYNALSDFTGRLVTGRKVLHCFLRWAVWIAMGIQPFSIGAFTALFLGDKPLQVSGVFWLGTDRLLEGLVSVVVSIFWPLVGLAVITLTMGLVTGLRTKAYQIGTREEAVAAFITCLVGAPNVILLTGLIAVPVMLAVIWVGTPVGLLALLLWSTRSRAKS